MSRKKLKRKRPLRAPPAPEFVMTHRVPAVVVESAVTPLHGSATGNRITCAARGSRGRTLPRGETSICPAVVRCLPM